MLIRDLRLEMDELRKEMGLPPEARVALSSAVDQSGAAEGGQPAVSQERADELKALLDYMEVEYDKAIDSKTRLVALIIHQKRRGDAVAATQRIWRRTSSHRAATPAEPFDIS